MKLMTEKEMLENAQKMLQMDNQLKLQKKLLIQEATVNDFK
jgi:hypothetical protein